VASFAISMFPTDLSFASEVPQDQARIGIFAAAVIATVLGAVTFNALPERRNLDIAEHADRC
jgi:Na+/H+ antiporter NhaA